MVWTKTRTDNLRKVYLAWVGPDAPAGDTILSSGPGKLGLNLSAQWDGGTALVVGWLQAEG